MAERKTEKLLKVDEMILTAIIVNYFTEVFLPNLLFILEKEECIAQIVIADNGSAGNLEEIATDFSKVKVKTFDHNIGFGAAVNHVAAFYPSDYYLVINPDTLPEPGFAANLLRSAVQTDALIAGPRMYLDEAKQFRHPPAFGYSWLIHFVRQLMGSNTMDVRIVNDQWRQRSDWFWKADKPFADPFLSGACLLIKNDNAFFVDGKLFDERFFLYYEDTDLCYQAYKQQKRVIVVPDSVVIHFWNQSPVGKKGQFLEESCRLFLLKQYMEVPIFQQPAGLPVEMPNVVKLGRITSSTPFTLDDFHDEERYIFELRQAVNFPPFAEADMVRRLFQIPTAVLCRLRPGTYFSSVRNEYYQTLKIWQWKV